MAAFCEAAPKSRFATQRKEKTMTTQTIATNNAAPSAAPREAHQRADRELIASCRSPRVEIARVGSKFTSRVKITRTGWMEGSFGTLTEAVVEAKRYIREATFGRVDPDLALKFRKEAE
jgi:hypothetical protein